MEKFVFNFFLGGGMEGLGFINSRHIYPILSRTFALEFDGTVTSSQLPFPSFLGGNDTNTLLFASGQHASRLPPFVVRGVGDVQNISVAEKQATTGQSVVLVGVVVKKGPGLNQNKSS